MGIEFRERYLEGNARRIFELEEQLNPRAREAAMQMHNGPEKLSVVKKREARRRLLARTVRAARNLCNDNPDELATLLSDIRILIEHQMKLPEGALKKRPSVTSR